MKYIREIWVTMTARYTKAFDDEFVPLATRVGFKAKRGEVKVPITVMREIVAQAYHDGARAALAMAADVDGTD